MKPVHLRLVALLLSCIVFVAPAAADAHKKWSLHDHRIECLSNEVALRAAEKGDPVAQKELGMRLRMGWDCGQRGMSRKISPDLPAARHWLLRAADRGQLTAMSWVADMFMKGEGGPKDTVSGFRWHKRAAERGSAYSQQEVGMFMMENLGRFDSAVAVRDYLRPAALEGKALAASVLATHLAGKNEPEAVNWLVVSLCRIEPYADKSITLLESQAYMRKTLERLSAYTTIHTFNKRKEAGAIHFEKVMRGRNPIIYRDSCVEFPPPVKE